MGKRIISRDDDDDDGASDGVTRERCSREAAASLVTDVQVHIIRILWSCINYIMTRSREVCIFTTVENRAAAALELISFHIYYCYYRRYTFFL